MHQAAELPLSTLLSQVLVAFTIEFDNEFEHRMPHRTTNHGGERDGPWLVSMVMWSNCMRFVGEEGITVGRLEDLARTTTNLNGMVRWGYITVERDRLIRATPKGRKAQEVWKPLFGAIEARWRERFGNAEIDQLRESLQALISRLDVDLPDCLPILGYGLFSRVSDHPRRPPGEREESLSLPALLSRVLLAFAVSFERKSDLSLAISANVLRVLGEKDEKGVRVRDLPLLTGVSKEAISMAAGVLQKNHVAEIATERTGSRAKVIRLTAKGREAQEAYRERLAFIEERWKERFGQDAIRNLREPLERLVGELFLGLVPYPDAWRASVRTPGTLPHYPMVLHRGGFPDGS
jgi:DNA-binding MarR family transcriptional regulator